MLLPRIPIRDERLHNGNVRRQPANDLQRQQWVPQMIEHAQKEDDVELPQARARQLIDLQDAVIDL
jgi:hypothetical protein